MVTNPIRFFSLAAQRGHTLGSHTPKWIERRFPPPNPAEERSFRRSRVMSSSSACLLMQSPALPKNKSPDDSEFCWA